MDVLPRRLFERLPSCFTITNFDDPLAGPDLKSVLPKATSGFAFFKEGRDALAAFG